MIWLYSVIDYLLIFLTFRDIYSEYYLFIMALSTLDGIGLSEINEILKLEQIFHNNYLTVDFLH